MGTPKTVKPNQKAIQDSNAMWHNFVLLSKVCGACIAVTLVLMGLFLV